ncbi:MAG: molybdate ABC transporter substrate-binding protein [Caldilineaceae bacterium]|nr:molybdate ABC transporter substrate-binding protein [Caldilineaceae bacterium]
MFRLLLFLSLISPTLAACTPIANPPPAAQSGAADDSVELTVGAAADLQFAFTELGRLFQEETGHRVTMVFGSTGQLAQQIENGAPYDLYAAANIEFVEMLAEKKLVLPETVALYGRGRIVLAVNREAGVEASELNDLLAPEIQRIAIANPEHAPYGRAAKEALESSGVWTQLQDKLVLGENVRQTLQYVQTGDAQVGIVALSIADVPEITWTLIDDALHNPLDQALAVVSSSPHAAIAAEFAAFINGPTGRPIMQRYGFVLPGEAISTPN